MIGPPNNALLHGMTLEMILTCWWNRTVGNGRGRSVTIRCFTNDPSIKSSLQFLRKTPWAGKKVEELYLQCARESADTAK